MMSSSDEEELLLLLALNCKRKRRWWWMHEINEKWECLGEYYHLCLELQSQGECFFKYHTKTHTPALFQLIFQ